MIREAIETVVSGASLSMEESAAAMREIMDGEATPAQISAFVTALRIRGETPEEIAGMATVMRDKALPLDVEGPLVDTCGTGGDGKGTFNVSTAAAFVAAGAGLRVAKHGNRAASGICGSADVLEALGVKVDLDPAGVRRCILEVGIGFMFAPTFHPAMRHAAPVRREIGIRTAFNILGPLTNPARAQRQLIGVAEPNLGEKVARVLALMGCLGALVVHGDDGLDEVSLGAANRAWELKGGSVRSYSFSADDLGLPRVTIDQISGGAKEENAATLRRTFQGEAGPIRDVVVANAAAALMVGGAAGSLKEGVDLAQRTIDGGEALRKVDGLVELSRRLA
ncbi:MAG: anthranilate phosphoribosyltransferase [Dehalococcoidia bacterium]|nr:anthranilate phosphoribosyltransferase [Dehalococcoidia bacterium]